MYNVYTFTLTTFTIFYTKRKYCTFLDFKLDLEYYYKIQVPTLISIIVCAYQILNCKSLKQRNVVIDLTSLTYMYTIQFFSN